MIWPKLLHPVAIPLFLSALATFGASGGLFDLTGDAGPAVPDGGRPGAAASARAQLAARLAPGSGPGIASGESQSPFAPGGGFGGISQATFSGEDSAEGAASPTDPAGPQENLAGPAPTAPASGPGDPTLLPTPVGDATPAPAARLLYLRNSTLLIGDTTSQPVLPLTSLAPGSDTLFNCDTNRDAFPGLLITRGAIGADETDPAKYQEWRMPVLTKLAIDGNVTLTLWSAMKDFNTTKSGRITVFLRDFNGVSHTNIAQGVLTQSNWSGGSSFWVEKTVTIPAVNHTLPAGHQLEIKLIVDSSSADDMWFAYDTVSYASRLQLP